MSEPDLFLDGSVAPSSPDSPTKTAKVMIVDDDPGTVELVQHHLGALGYWDFAACTDAQQAFQRIAAEAPDVLLLDLVMPHTSGLEILAQVRQSAELRLLPVIIMTVVNGAATKIRALELGATDFLTKPVDFAELAARIRNALVAKACHDRLRRRSEELERLVELKTARLKESYAALENANLVLRRSCEAAEAAARVKGEFLAKVSHELRTPLTAIIGFTEELLAGGGGLEASSQSVRLIETVLRNAKHLLHVVNDLLDVARIEQGRLEIARTECSPNAILAEVVRMLRPLADAKGIELAMESAGPIPDTIHTDPARLRQILINLLGNAIKFTAKGSVRVVARLLDGEAPCPRLEFAVIDTGMGIDAARLDEIFEPFAQACGAADGRSGTGLGLTISRYLARELGGDIQVQSELGRGSTFRVTIAAAPAPAASRASEDLPSAARHRLAAAQPTGDSPAQSKATGPTLLGSRILVAEDAPDNQRLIRLILEKAGAEVASVEDGQAALEAALAAWRQAAPFDVILTDIQMPLVDGYDLAARLRESGYPGPIVALTANACTGEREKCLAAGCDAYLSKPIDRHALVALVARYLPAASLSLAAEA